LTARDPVRPVSVVLPMLTLVTGGMGGTETYARELTKGLAVSPSVDVLTLVPRGAAGFSGGGRELVSSEVLGGGSTGERLRSQMQALRSSRLRSAVAGADVAHFPFSVPVPRPPRGTPWVQTIHDVQHFDFPSFFPRLERAYRRLAYDGPARRADAVITISQFSRERIIKHLRVAPERVRVAPLGVDTDEFSPRRGPRGDFVLYPARGWPHKNHQRLVRAMHRVRETHPGMRLVLTGGGLDALGTLPAWVENRGLVPREELVELYRSAACLAFPSLYEGFGLPPLEAMASGCPVASSNAGSLPEICGDAAVLFDPHEPDAIAAAIIEAVSARDRLAAAGLERVTRFTWKACADIHADLYREVAADHPHRRGG
jgi:glycosyltransferase involved in cell wall biosynthesis